MPRHVLSSKAAPGPDNDVHVFEAVSEAIRPEYDIPEGIEGYLTDLAGLRRLIADRHKAAYGRRERLHDFVILGRWRADSCGNFGKCEIRVDFEPTKAVAKLPQVVTVDALFELSVQDLGGEIRLSSGVDSEVPAPHLRCPECNKGWTLADAHDTFVHHRDFIVPLTPGKTILEREHDWDEKSEGIYRFRPEPSVCNAKFIDRTPHPIYTEQLLNERGWRHHHPAFRGERLTHEYVAEEGDAASMSVWLYFHKRCHELFRARNEREDFLKIFADAGMPNVILNETPNEYDPYEGCAPWFIARLPFGDIKIGWRKRVINIDWSATKRDLTALFEGEDVTKGTYYIHAYGPHKAMEYLTGIRRAFEGL
jgi:hypothetical protein